VLIAKERKDRLALVAPIVANLGHEVIACEIDIKDVGAVTARERPDVALVGLGKSSEHALALIDKIVKEAASPVILLIPRCSSALTRGQPAEQPARARHRARARAARWLSR
jgi:chemotaxis response regulator CheB